MALNSNHTFEDLEEIKCSIVEKNCSKERVDFLKQILEFNNFKVVVVPSPPPKVAVVSEPDTEVTPIPETFTVGVTDLSFNPTKAIYNRELKSPSGNTITPEFWKQLESVSNDQIWYWKK